MAASRATGVNRYGGISLEQYQSARRFGVSVVVLTLVFRLFEAGLPQGAARLLRWLPISPNKQTEAGREARHFSFPFPAESSPPASYVPEPTRPVFTQEQAESLAVTNPGACEPDCAALLTAPLEWNLASDAPTVLIVHTHTSESYERGGADYAETAAYRTLDEEYNMLRIGDLVAQLLEAEGIGVIHDREFHDYPSYNSAYTHARKAIQAQLLKNPQIRLVLDLHRDAMEDGGRQVSTHAALGGRDCAQLMTVLGVGRSGLPNDRWEENLSLALKLQVLLQEQCPGIARPISLRPQRFNQDLAPYSLLIEVGTAGDTREKALLAATQLAAALIQLKDGTSAALP